MRSRQRITRLGRRWKQVGWDYGADRYTFVPEETPILIVTGETLARADSSGVVEVEE